MWRLDSSIDQAAPRTGMPAALGAAAWAAAAWAAAAWATVVAAAAATVRTRHSNPNCSGRRQHTSLLCSTKDSCLHRGCGSNCNTKRCATLDHAHAHAHAMQLTRTCHAHAHAHAHVHVHVHVMCMCTCVASRFEWRSLTSVPRFRTHTLSKHTCSHAYP